MKKTGLCILLVIFITSQAFALTGLEYVKLEPSKQKEFVTPYIHKYIEEGYKKVPDWAYLIITIESMIREHGWGSKDVSEIIPLAAIKLGMTK